MSDAWFDGYADGEFLPEPDSTPEEQDVSAYAQGYADAAGHFATATADRCYWLGYADGVEDGVGPRRRSDPRRLRSRSLTRPGGGRGRP